MMGLTLVVWCLIPKKKTKKKCIVDLPVVIPRDNRHHQREYNTTTRLFFKFKEEEFFDGWIVNTSKEGFCFTTNVEINPEVGQNFQYKKSSSGSWKNAEIRHCCREHYAWVIGCKKSRPFVDKV